MENNQDTRFAVQPTWIIAGALVVLLILVGYRFFSSPVESPPAAAGPVDLGPPTAAVSPQQVRPESRVMESVEAERQAIAKARLLKLSQAADEIQDLILDLENEISTWAAEVEPLLTNDAGKVLAADETGLQAFHQIYAELERSSPKTPERLNTLLENYISPVRQALADPYRTYSPSQELEAHLADLNASAERAIESYAEPRRQIQSLLASAVKKGVETSSDTLRRAVDALAERHALEEAQAIAAAVESERKAAATKMAELEAENVRKEAERELAKKRLEDELRQKEAERERAAMKSAEERKAAQAQLDELKKRAADPAIQAKYQPFLAKGKYRFRLNGGLHGGDPYDYPVPASLKNLREVGVLNSVKVFFASGAGYAQRFQGYNLLGMGNDRPCWPGWPNTEEDWKHVQELYVEFLQLAPIWVETGVLRP